jgi:diguanylate cyclase (GGDEF)-like protein
MHNLNLVKQSIKDILPGVLSDRWEPAILENTPETYIHDLARARVSLADAERVIRSQQEQIRRLEDLALTDELTGLLNRRGFILALQRELSMARRDSGIGGSVVMIDLDGFKSINDMWGHSVGDDYLQAVAHALLGSVRSGDLVARLGGDEFALLFSKMNDDTGRRRLAKLEASFNSRMVDFGHTTLPLRASFGLYCYDGLDMPEQILAMADRKLYDHKAQRKSRSLISG